MTPGWWLVPGALIGLAMWGALGLTWVEVE